MRILCLLVFTSLRANFERKLDHRTLEWKNLTGTSDGHCML